MEDKEQQKQVWSAAFWREKIIRTLIAILLLVVLLFLWNWDSDTETASTGTEQEATTQTQQTQTQTQTETSAPAEPAYTLTLPDSASSAVQTQASGNPVETYTLVDGATIAVYTQGGLTSPTDITWEYTVSADTSAEVVERIDSLCAAGSDGCSAGNGQLEITVSPQSVNDGDVQIYIIDDNIDTKTVAQMTAQYEEIINSLKVSN
ncbi:MAG: hypothetical protein AAF413_03585 [Patescibacteria group bacterium]